MDDISLCEYSENGLTIKFTERSAIFVWKERHVTILACGILRDLERVIRVVSNHIFNMDVDSLHEDKYDLMSTIRKVYSQVIQDGILDIMLVHND